jgi:CSLREA domain-containing protein
MFHRDIRVEAVMLSALAMLGLTALPALAQTTYVVDTFTDSVDANPGDGICLDANGECSLRAAIMEANANSGIVDILLPQPGTYTLTISSLPEDDCLSGDLDVNPTSGLTELNLFGQGSANTRIEASFAPGLQERVLHINPAGTAVHVLVRGMTMRGGVDTTGSGGGAILHEAGQLDLEDVHIRDSSTTTHGGSVRANATVTIDQCNFSRNSANGNGGGLYLASGTAAPNISVTQFDGNTASSGGGAFFAGGSSTAVTGGAFTFNEATQGGAIRNFGDSILRDVLFQRNRAIGGGNGGAIANQSPGDIRFIRCTFENNEAANGGGAVNNTLLGIFEAVDSAFLFNVAVNLGGAMSNAGDASLTRCELAHNRSDGLVANAAGGGAIYNQSGNGMLRIVNCTLTDNAAVQGVGGAIANDFGGTVELSASTLYVNGAQVGNSIFNGDTGGSTSNMFIVGSILDDTNAPPGAFDNIVAPSPVTSFGFNINVDGTGMAPAPGDQFGTPGAPIDVMLGLLQNNGGPTRTHELLPGSPAIDLGACFVAAGNVLTEDQRGFFRPEDGDGNGSAECDVGAFEAPAVGMCANWTVVRLHPGHLPGVVESRAFGVHNGEQVGQIDLGGSRASLWTGSSVSWVDLHPPVAGTSEGFGVFNGWQVGSVSIGGSSHASLWNGTAASWVDLHPAGATFSTANGIGSHPLMPASGQQVGATFVGGVHRANFWLGTAASWSDLHPVGATFSIAYGANDGRQVGMAIVGGVAQASLWSDSAASWVSLHPGIPVAFSSTANGVHAGEQVGFVSIGGNSHASLWTGTAASWVDLHPGAAASTSIALRVFAGRQVGFAVVGGISHASYWAGSAASWEDLHPCLPPEFASGSSSANDVWDDGVFTYVAGYGFNTVDMHYEAVMWVRPSAPSACPTCRGDMNGDNHVDGLDIQDFVDCYIQGPGIAAGCDCADMNGDGQIDLADRVLFINRLLQPGTTMCP